MNTNDNIVICVMLLLASKSRTAKCICSAARWQVCQHDTVYKAEATKHTVIGHCSSTDIAGDCRCTQVQRDICWCHGAVGHWWVP